MLPSLSQLSIGGAYDDEDTRSDTSSSSSSSSDSESEPDEQLVPGALYRSYLKFTVSQDSQNQSFLSPMEFAQLDLYQIEALRDDDDPLALNKEMQGATRHFPCHVFWSKELASGKYAVWGRPTVGLHEQEAVIRMLQAQRQERQEYISLLNQLKWQEECERKMREQQLKASADAATKRATERRRVERRGRRVHWKNPTSAGRVASVLHRILRRRQDTDERISEEQTATLLNRGLKRLGLKALAAGSLALVSAVAYMQQLQAEQPQEAFEPAVIDGYGILQTPELAASADVYV